MKRRRWARTTIHMIRIKVCMVGGVMMKGFVVLLCCW
jgi:hypothetical protein